MNKKKYDFLRRLLFQCLTSLTPSTSHTELENKWISQSWQPRTHPHPSPLRILQVQPLLYDWIPLTYFDSQPHHTSPKSLGRDGGREGRGEKSTYQFYWLCGFTTLTMGHTAINKTKIPAHGTLNSRGGRARQLTIDRHWVKTSKCYGMLEGVKGYGWAHQIICPPNYSAWEWKKTLLNIILK